MRKIVLLAFAVFVLNVMTSSAQSYKTAVGLGIDFGDGSTLAGPAIKHFFNDKDAIEGEILFGSHVTFLQAFYNYQKDFPNANNLQWYLGGGGSLALYSGATRFYLRPMAGLDYKITDVPLAISFDWRPVIDLGSNGGFTGARFGLGFKYVLN